MKAFKLKSVSALAAGLLFLSMASSSYADSYSAQQEMRDNPTPAGVSTDSKVRHRSYGEKVGNKAFRSFANLAAAFIEVPRTILIYNNDENDVYKGNFVFAFGIGMVMGVAQSAGRIGTGIVDFITIPLPTESITRPEYPWQQFDVHTSYGDAFVLDKD